MIKLYLERYLAACARRAILREKPKVRVVVGSVGKTSTKEAIGVALGAHLPFSDIRVSPKNYNNELGVPLAIFNLDAPKSSIVAWIRLMHRATLVGLGLRGIGAKVLVLELGTDHPGDIEYLTNIAPPTLAVVTAIGAEHTEFFGSIDAVAREELIVVQKLPKTGIAILNADDPRVVQGRELTSATVLTFGEHQNADVRLLSATIVMDTQNPDDSGLDVDIVAFGLRATLRLKGVFGRSQALAVTAALAVIVALDVDFHEAVERLRDFQGAPGRTRLIEGIKHTMLLDDSYNASPLAVLSALRDLAAFPLQPPARRFAALGDMLELGALAQESHEEIGRAVAELGIDVLVVCGKLAHVVARAAQQAGMPEERIAMFPTSEDVGLYIQHECKMGDAILIKGSRGVRMEKVTKELMAHPELAETLLVHTDAF